MEEVDIKILYPAQFSTLQNFKTVYAHRGRSLIVRFVPAPRNRYSVSFDMDVAHRNPAIRAGLSGFFVAALYHTRLHVFRHRSPLVIVFSNIWGYD
ncbi:MAG: hypothetical protein J4452_00745 [Candidatus Aenigmarchaeota archaeon]|nr:hypothetical protein [Candidatus Aenigmarchaeota archaeon]